MTNTAQPDFDPNNAVHNPCPNCCEADADKLVWLDDEETVRCTSCGQEYKP